jgi:methylated-DNA-protein-cysteine methyltransferase-like protein
MKSSPRSPGPVSTHAKIYAVLRRVPRGRVVTYGQVATLAGLDGQPRLVGYALHALATGTKLPWHRVINARGTVSIRSNGTASLSQRLLLEREGIAFDARGRVSLERYRWKPSRSTLRQPNRRGK